jgi:hypothetical protein
MLTGRRQKNRPAVFKADCADRLQVARELVFPPPAYMRVKYAQ